MTIDDLAAWGDLCGWALARGHARSRRARRDRRLPGQRRRVRRRDRPVRRRLRRPDRAGPRGVRGRDRLRHAPRRTRHTDRFAENQSRAGTFALIEGDAALRDAHNGRRGMDRALVDAARSGDEEAFAAIARGSAESAVHRRTGSCATSEGTGDAMPADPSSRPGGATPQSCSRTTSSTPRSTGSWSNACYAEAKRDSRWSANVRGLADQ